MVNTILKEADLFCPNSVRINFTIYHKTKVNTSNLLAGITKSCGCLDKENRAKFAKLNFKDLTGKRFGMLTVLRQSNGVKKGAGATWFCKCDCGNYTDVASTKLIQGTTQSCGCRLKKAREKWKSIYKDEKIQEKVKHTFRQNDGREKGTKLSILKLAIGDKLKANNASGVTGVSYSKRDKRWRSYITVKHVRYNLGYFKDKESAIQARK